MADEQQSFGRFLVGAAIVPILVVVVGTFGAMGIGYLKDRLASTSVELRYSGLGPAKNRVFEAVVNRHHVILGKTSFTSLGIDVNDKPKSSPFNGSRDMTWDYYSSGLTVRLDRAGIVEAIGVNYHLKDTPAIKADGILARGSRLEDIERELGHPEVLRTEHDNEVHIEYSDAKGSNVGMNSVNEQLVEMILSRTVK